MGIDGFEFVEFAAPEGQGEAMHDYFARMGFSAVLRHKTRPITVYRQGGVNFLLNEDPFRLPPTSRTSTARPPAASRTASTSLRPAAGSGGKEDVSRCRTR